MFHFFVELSSQYQEIFPKNSLDSATQDRCEVLSRKMLGHKCLTRAPQTKILVTRYDREHSPLSPVGKTTGLLKLMPVEPPNTLYTTCYRTNSSGLPTVSIVLQPFGSYRLHIVLCPRGPHETVLHASFPTRAVDGVEYRIGLPKSRASRTQQLCRLGIAFLHKISSQILEASICHRRTFTVPKQADSIENL